MTNDRINWLITIQGLLFTALGFAWDKSDTKWLIVAFSFLGIMVALSAWTSLIIANQSRRELAEWWVGHKSPDYDGPDVIGIRKFKQTPARILRPWRSLPFIFIIGWIIIFAINLDHF